jgi:hypothetical protein
MYRFEARYVGRSQGKSSTKTAAHNTGKRTSAVASAAYLARAAITDERTGQTWDYSRHFGGAGAELMLPPGALPWMNDRSKLWNQIEKIENRKDSMLAPDFIVTADWRLSREQQWAAIKEFAWEQIVSQGKPADIGLHIYGEPWSARAKKTAQKLDEWKAKGIPFYEMADAPKEDSGPHIAIHRSKSGKIKEYYLYQPHFHVMTTFRKIDPESSTGFAKHKETVTKRHWAVEAGEQLDRYRAAWARIGANALEDAGLPLAAARFRVGHQKLPEQREAAKERGDLEWAKQLDRMPEPKKGPVAAKLEREDRGHEAHAITDWQLVKDYNALKARMNDRQERIDNLQEERKKRMQPEEQYAEDQRRAFDGKVKEQLDQIEAMAESGRERDRFRQAFEAEQEEAEKLAKDRLYSRTQDADITDARTRWLEAVADSPRQREWEQALAAAVGIEGARAKREHDELTKEAALAKDDPDKQKDILLKRDIQFWDYMALTEERQVGISRGITGYTQRRDLNEPDDKPVKRPWEVHRDAALEYREIANQLRQEREEHNERAAVKEMQQIDRDITAGGERIFAAARAKQEAANTTEQADATAQNRRDGQWREVDSDKEIFDPGRQFQFNQTTGKPEVWEPAQTKEEQVAAYLARESNTQSRLDIDQRNDGYALVRNGEREEVVGWAPTREDLHELIVDRLNREQASQPQRENPFDTMARRDQERHDAARETTDARKERPEAELSDLAKERMAMLGMQWNAEEREISQAQDRSRGGGMSR